MPTLPANLAKGAIHGGFKVLEVVNAAAGQYILGKAEDPTIATAIAEWSATRVYGPGNICMRNSAFFKSAVANNTGKDPSIDTSGAWGPFVPGETNSLFFNRAPTNADVHPVGVKWYDTSFGADTPLVMISMGSGVWAYLNQITLAKIRIFGHGVAATYRSNINSLAFFKPDGTQIPNSWFVWGVKSGFWGTGAGVAFAGQNIEAGYNTWGWADIEVSSQFDPSITIGKITGQTPYFSCDSFEFWYTNGSKKIFSPGGAPTLCNCSPPIICRYGDAVAAAQGEMLTAGKLVDPNSNDYGRISGAAFVSAFNQLLAPLIDRLAALEPKPAPAVLAVTIEKGFPSPDQSTARLTPPEGKDFKPGGLFWMLNRIAPDNASISQGTGSTDTTNFATPTEPGTYMLIMQPTYDDNSTGDVRETFQI